MARPLVSIVIRCKNGMKFVDACLKSVFQTRYNPIEIIFVDDASTDGTPEYVRSKYGNLIRLVKLPKTSGPTKASNIGTILSKGKYVAYLDVDTQVTPTWLDAPIKLLEKKSRVGAIQCKIFFTKGGIDSIGHYLHILGYPLKRTFFNADPEVPSEIFGGKQAAMIFRKSALKEVGYFDENIFFLFEESDLCWRLLLRGYRIIYVPNSVVYHHGGGTTGPYKYFIAYMRQKNTLYSMIKNYEVKTLLKIMPCLLYTSPSPRD